MTAGRQSLAACWLCWVLGLLVLTGSIAAHPVYMDHIEHQVQLSISPEHVDITVVLRFNEFRSLAERRRMDINRDEVISQSERAAYLRRVSLQCLDAIRLELNGRALEITELYDPKLDLLGVEGVSPNHHVLKLCYFARTGRPLKDPDELILHDGTFAGVPSLWLFDAKPQRGQRMRVEVVGAPASAPAERSDLTGRCRIRTSSTTQPASTRQAACETDRSLKVVACRVPRVLEIPTVWLWRSLR